MDPFTSAGQPTPEGKPHTRPEGKECPSCGSLQVHWADTNGQAVAHCDGCGASRGNIPKPELGLAPKKYRSSSAETVDPTQRARVLMRDRSTCVLCRSTDGPFHVDHLVSLKEGSRYPSLIEALGSDENLALMCQDCNLAKGSQSAPLLFMVALHLEWKRNRA